MGVKSERKGKSRIEIIDGLRGLSVVLMVIYHGLYNATVFLGAPAWMFHNPVFDILQYFFAGLFIFLCGVSSRLTRSNIKRGLIAAAIAVVISAVTYLMVMPIWFGILHLLSFCMLFFGLTGKLWDLIPRKAAPFVFIPLIAGSALARAHITLASEMLWARNALAILGWRQPGRFDRALLPWHPDFVFGSLDYFPVLPWVFVFLLGTWAGLYVAEKKLPGWFYSRKIPVFPIFGRNALPIYVLHQPVLYGITMGILYLRAG